MIKLNCVEEKIGIVELLVKYKCEQIIDMRTPFDVYIGVDGTRWLYFW